MRRLLAGLALLLLAACGEAASKDVGSACEDGDGCEVRSNVACVLTWPEGYCTEFGCTIGSCPEGARCVMGITFDRVPYDAFCLATCDNEGDCRDGYRCVDVNLPERVCAPGNT